MIFAEQKIELAVKGDRTTLMVGLAFGYGRRLDYPLVELLNRASNDFYNGKVTAHATQRER